MFFREVRIVKKKSVYIFRLNVMFEVQVYEDLLKINSINVQVFFYIYVQMNIFNCYVLGVNKNRKFEKVVRVRKYMKYRKWKIFFL